jgi:hypothetical protein
MNLGILILSAFCLCPVFGALAGEMKAECPVGIPPTSIKPGEPVAGWVTTPEQMHLRAAGMMMGGPETAMYVDPVSSTKARQVFEFDKGDGERWLWCSYGGVKLTRRLDDRATRCTLLFRTQSREGAPTLTVVAECK